jgi:hypothetical protein
MEGLIQVFTDRVLAFGGTPSMGISDPAAALFHANFQC